MCNFLSIGYAAAMQSCIVNSVINEGNYRVVTFVENIVEVCSEEVAVIVDGNAEDSDDGEI